MRLLIATIAATLVASTAFAGGLTTGHGHYVKPGAQYIKPKGKCSGGIFAGGCGYCLNGYYYPG